MNKSWLIIQREYLSRVKKKSFILITLFIPIIIVGFLALEIFIFTGAGSNNHKNIVVIDESGLFQNKLQSKDDLHFIFKRSTFPDHPNAYYKKEQTDGFLYIPDINLHHPKGFLYFSDHQLGLNTYLYITDQLNQVIKDQRMVLAGIDKKKVEAMTAHVSLIQQTPSSSKSENNKYITYASSAIGYISGFLIYFALILFGTQVLRGVAEEKTNRISEIMVSSVKPSQLMTGKILGIGAVGLTQFIIWIVFLLIGITVFGAFLPGGASLHEMQQAGSGNSLEAFQVLAQAQGVLSILPITEIILGFFFYFFGGYILYAALFAAVGSAVDQEITESQSLTLPITMPLILSFFVMFATIQEPNSTLAVFCSIFPLSSPIVMMARIPYGVPAWQLILSIALLIITLLATIKIAGKIYRTGILLYGKKITFKEITKWIFRKS